LVEAAARSIDQLGQCGRLRRSHSPDDPTAAGGDASVRFACETAAEFVVPVTCVNDVGVSIDESRDDAAAACVDARRILRDGHGIGTPEGVADIGDSSIEGSNDPISQQGEFALCESAAGRRAGAGRNHIGMFDEEVGWDHGELG
jgi:hypothetical protein